MIRRIVFSVLAFASVIAALVAGSQLSAEPPAGVQATTAAVTPARQDVACPGDLVTPSGGTGTDPELGGAATGVSASTFLEGATRAVGDGEASDAVVGAHVQRVGGGDITGLAALTCTTPSTDQWVLAGETVVGGSARLVLTNPSAAAVEATVTAFGEIGKVDSRTVAIGPDSQQEVLLEGVAVDVTALAVHITATGTGVVAALQDSRLGGFQPNGTEWATASAVGTELAIPGVGTGGASTQTAAVRLIAPEGATVRMGLSTPDGAATWEGVADLHLEPGVAIEVPVPTVDVGTVTISADAPVTAAAIAVRTRPASTGVEGDTAQEIRWVPAQAAADDNERAAIAVGYDERVVVYAQRRGTFTLSDADGATVGTVQVAAGGTATIPIDVPPGTVLNASGPYAWTVLVGDGDFIAALAPTRTTIDPVEITVEQRDYVPSP